LRAAKLLAPYVIVVPVSPFYTHMLLIWKESKAK